MGEEAQIDVLEEMVQKKEVVAPPEICCYEKQARKFLKKDKSGRVQKQLEDKLWLAWGTPKKVLGSWRVLGDGLFVIEGSGFGALVGIVNETGKPPYMVHHIEGSSQDLTRHRTKTRVS